MRQEPRLVPARVFKLAVRLLQLPEEPGFLDRDERLIGERLHQRHLLRRERPDLMTHHPERPDRSIRSTKRHAQHGSLPIPLLARA
jgi:hypothetical protein